ncbi:N-acetylglucosaminylphosphatidylinositol deacetylase, putative [Eimeria praecox]|uniref:N-acetylglucosaminylphosphatidylinositol deacetylase n=1 Tax=Eimeria praecox TaxID=51316 RepID=U6H5A9_9EIME|nr:N-acetylglucosaminylphosphatidylinositol deacetylase, putative [Eimeria praecox]
MNRYPDTGSAKLCSVFDLLQQLPLHRSTAGKQQQQLILACLFDLIMASSVVKNGKAGDTDDMATAPTADTSPAADAVAAGDLSSSNNSSSSSSSASSNRSSSTSQLPPHRSAAGKQQQQLILACLFDLIMASSVVKNGKAGDTDDMATAPTADTSPAADAAAAGDLSSSNSSSSSSSSASSNRSNSTSVRSNTNYGVALGAIGAALSVTLLQYLPRLFSAEGRAAFRAALLEAGGGSILYNARLAHNWRLERFLVALVSQQRRQQQHQQQQLLKEQQHHHTREPQKCDEQKEQQQEGHEHEEECCCSDEEEEKIGVLFVTAHPDDECMFFAPSLSLFASKKERFEVFLLCLSTGDYEGLGAERTAELFAAAGAFGIPKENVCCLDDKNMKDGWTTWSSKTVCEAVKRFLKDRPQRIHCIFTFDGRGVSSHPNHISVYEGLRLLNEEVIEECKRQHEQQMEQRKGQVELRRRDDGLKEEQKNVQQEKEEEQQQELHALPSVFIFSLQTHGLIRKYCGALNLIPATVEANNKGVDVAASLTPFSAIRCVVGGAAAPAAVAAALSVAAEHTAAEGIHTASASVMSGRVSWGLQLQLFLQ